MVGGVGDAALPAGAQEVRHDLHGLGGGAGAFEAEADQVHADQRGLGRRCVMRRADTLVPDGDAVLVDAVLGPPQPGGTGEERCVRAGVADGEVLRAQRASRRGAAAEGPGDLDLAGWAIGILGEHHAAPARGTEGVAHGRSVERVDRVAVRGTTRRPHRRRDRSLRHRVLGPAVGRAGGRLPDAPARASHAVLRGARDPRGAELRDPEGEGLLRARRATPTLPRPAGTRRSSSRAAAPPPSSTCPRRCSTSSAP